MIASKCVWRRLFTYLSSPLHFCTTFHTSFLMACSAASAALISSNPSTFPAKTNAPIASAPFSRTLALPKSFLGLRKSFQPSVPRSISSSRGAPSRRSFAVRASVSVFSLVKSLVGDLCFLFAPLLWIFSV